MGQALVFDTHVYVKKLEKAGFSEEQAEVLASTQAELIDERLATKADIKSLEASTKADIKSLEASTKADIKSLEASTKADLKRLELNLKQLEINLKKDITIEVEKSKAEIIKWCVGSIFAAVGMFATIMKLLQ